MNMNAKNEIEKYYYNIPPDAPSFTDISVHPEASSPAGSIVEPSNGATAEASPVSMHVLASLEIMNPLRTELMV